MNISPKYHPGIELAPGHYDVLVERSGYRSVRQWVTIVHTNVEIDLQLSRQTADTRRQETSGFLGAETHAAPVANDGITRILSHSQYVSEGEDPQPSVPKGWLVNLQKDLTKRLAAASRTP